MAIQLQVYDSTGKKSGEVSVSDEVFGAKPKEHLLFDAVQMQLASRRSGTAKTKVRSEVRGGGTKPWKQKGTGRARAGTLRSPLFPGGGKVFGPRPRDYSYRLPQQVREQALRTALSQKCREGKLLVVDEFKSKEFKTKMVKNLFDSLKVTKGLVVDSKNDVLYRSVRNLSNGKYIDVEGLNVFDVLKYDHLFITKTSLKAIEERLVP